MLLRTVISANQLSIYGALADLVQRIGQIKIRRFSWRFTRKFRKLRNTSCKRNVRDETIIQNICIKNALKMQDACLAATQQSLRPIRPEHQQRQRQDQQFGGGRNFDNYVDRQTGWRYWREPRGNPSAASSSSTSQWPTSQWKTSWSSWQPTSSEKWWWFRFPGKNSRKSTEGVDRKDTHSQYTSEQYSLCTTAERKPRAWLK